VPWYNQGHWGSPKTNDSYCAVTGPLIDRVHFPANLTFTDFGDNNFAAVLKPDARTVFYPHPLYVCEPGGPMLAMLMDDNGPGELSADIYSDDGNLGDQFGSGLNAMASALRKGQLVPGAPPIRHALCIEFFGHDYYFTPTNASHTDCFRWPAVQCDHHERNCTPLVPGTNPLDCYTGTDPKFRPGSLLALPPGARAALSARPPPTQRPCSTLATRLPRQQPQLHLIYDFFKLSFLSIHESNFLRDDVEFLTDGSTF
jgi:hypothetical protein